MMTCGRCFTQILALRRLCLAFPSTRNSCPCLSARASYIHCERARIAWSSMAYTFTFVISAIQFPVTLLLTIRFMLKKLINHLPLCKGDTDHRSTSCYIDAACNFASLGTFCRINTQHSTSSLSYLSRSDNFLPERND